MGMRQRLAIGAALLGDPEVLILDEPTNGLDPPGIRWMRDLLRSQAAHGRAVLVSSHVLSEVAASVDDVVVISRGTLRASGSLEAVLGTSDGPTTRVRAAHRDGLLAALSDAGISAELEPSGAVLARGTAPEAVGIAAARRGVALSELVAVARSLEEAFFDLTEAQA
jgi:ABC-2 type transport system ATP-binding protein